MEPVVRLHGDADRLRDPEMREAVLDAMQDVAEGCPRLRRGFFGIKDYDRFRGQRSDHPYGWGPRHGHTVASIVMVDRHLPTLTQEQIEVTVHYLADLIGVAPVPFIPDNIILSET